MRRKYGIDQVSVRLVKEAPLLSEEEISTPEDAIRVLGDTFKDYDREVVGVVHLRSDNVPINMTIISMGTLNQSLVHPREVLKAAFLSNAASILLFHNHPSGNLNPSKEDIALTGRMQQLCMLAGIPVIDHVILGNDQSYFSFREKQILPMEQVHYSVDLDDINLKVAEKEAENYGYEKPHKKSIKESLEKNRKKIASGQKTSGVKKKRETTIE